MNFLTFWKKSRHTSRPKISLLIPFGSKDKHRRETMDWLISYWSYHLPDAEIILGYSNSKVFCKTEAFNNAAEIARGDVFVLLDADAYMSAKVIERCANRILEELDNGNHLWYVPYRHLYRLKRFISREILNSDPKEPITIPSHVPKEYIEGGTNSAYGKRYGAMVMIIPRQAFETLGCFDERFRGWGGEDASILRALDTLWGKHKTTNNPLFHLWHPTIGSTTRDRMWEGQKRKNSNDKLSSAYNRANRRPTEMRKIVDQGCKHRQKRNLLLEILFILTLHKKASKVRCEVRGRLK